MPVLLVALDIPIHPNRRARCLIHGGNNPTSFSWRDSGHWHCYRCLKHGDKISLIRGIKQCSFREALAFLSSLANVDLRRGAVWRRDSRQFQQERKRLERAAEILAHTERQVLFGYRNDIHRLERLRRSAADRISALACNVPPRFPQEEDCAWAALAIVAEELRCAVTGYSLLAFGTRRARFRFVFHPEVRPAMICSVLSCGGVLREGRRFRELLPL